VTRIKMGKLADLPVGGAIEKRIMARRVAVFNHDGRLIGMESDCKHMKASLTTGTIEEGILKCKWHGWRYDIETGECYNLKGVKLKRYDVEVEGDEVFLLWG
jgi:nitrite reductase (NADH) small subunit